MLQECVECTVVFLMRNNRVLLARGKKRMNKGLWNGYGGKKDPNETIRRTACREAAEEGGVLIQEMDLVYLGVMDFCWPTQGADVGVKGVKVVRSYMFVAHNWEGEPIETDESECPTWYDPEKVPYDTMFPAEQCWLPFLLAGRHFLGSVVYAQKRKWALKFKKSKWGVPVLTVRENTVEVLSDTVWEVPREALPPLR
ncbi:MAG TPA: NUDIX domain-containing protein [Patescibacteria group bacterium]